MMLLVCSDGNVVENFLGYGVFVIKWWLEFLKLLVVVNCVWCVVFVILNVNNVR